MKPLPELFLQAQKRNYRALVNQQAAAVKLRRSAHRRTDVKPGDVPLNSGEGLRAAYYVEDDPASYSSLEAAHQPDRPALSRVAARRHAGRQVIAYTPDNTPYRVVDARHSPSGRPRGQGRPHRRGQPRQPRYLSPGQQLRPEEGRVGTRDRQTFSPTRRADQLHPADPHVSRGQPQLSRPLARLSRRFRPTRSPASRRLIAALYDDFHPRNLRLYVNTPVGDDDWDLKFIADHSDGLLLMNYDEHQTAASPGRSPRRTGFSTI